MIYYNPLDFLSIQINKAVSKDLFGFENTRLFLQEYCLVWISHFLVYIIPKVCHELKGKPLKCARILRSRILYKFRLKFFVCTKIENKYMISKIFKSEKCNFRFTSSKNRFANCEFEPCELLFSCLMLCFCAAQSWIRVFNHEFRCKKYYFRKKLVLSRNPQLGMLLHSFFYKNI